MSFVIMKKKRFKFLVNFHLEDLSSVPYVSGVVFAKVRLLEGGNFTKMSSKEEIHEHRIAWNMKSQFQCKMTANPSNGILDDCLCRVSIRKETKGGKSFQKLGYTDLNLSEFAGGGPMTRRFLLNGYDAQHRQDNSVLTVHIEMSLLSGDPCFKVPSSHVYTHKLDDLQMSNKGEDNTETPCSSNSEGSNSFDSLKKREAEFEKGHSRNPSEHSRSSMGYGSLKGLHTHSRQSSSSNDPLILGHIRNASSGSLNSGGTAERRRKADIESKDRSRVDSTRIDADELIDEMVKGTNFQMDDSGEISGLQLFVNKDGTTSLGGGPRVKGQQEQQPVLYKR